MLNKMEPRDQLRAAIAEREKRRRCVVSAADALYVSARDTVAHSVIDDFSAAYTRSRG
jgi:hypothetical protein